MTPDHALRDTEKFWTDWTKNFQWRGDWKDAVLRSVIALKGLTYAPTGGIVAGQVIVINGTLVQAVNHNGTVTTLGRLSAQPSWTGPG